MDVNCRGLAATEQTIMDDGRYITTTYPVFPGIEFSFVDAHGQQIINEHKAEDSHVLKIVYCREGRSEFRLNDEFVFLSSGDLMIVNAAVVSPVMTFSLKHYHGLTVSIDLGKTPHCLSCFLEDVRVQPRLLADKFCRGSIGYIARQTPPLSISFRRYTPYPSRSEKAIAR